MSEPTGDWPLSAAATQVLRDPKAEGRDLLKLTLKELVLRKAWKVEERTVKRGLLGTQARSFLLPGERDVPHLGPLPRVDAALRGVCDPDGEDVRDAVKQIVGSGGRLITKVREDARAEAVAHGLVTIEKTRKLGVIPWTRIERTMLGEGWLAESWTREEALETTLKDRPEAAYTHAVAMAGLVLLVSPVLLTELDDAIIRLDQLGYAGSGGGGGEFDTGFDVDFGGAFDSSFDAAVDAGSSDGGGGGGDGGGGGGCGGGGGS